MLVNNDEKANSIFGKLQELNNKTTNDSPKSTKFSPKGNLLHDNTTNESFTLSRKRSLIKPRESSIMRLPESYSEFDLQLIEIAETLKSSVVNGKVINESGTLNYILKWYEGVIDTDTNKLHGITRNKLSEMSKDDLISYIEMLVNAVAY